MLSGPCPLALLHLGQATAATGDDDAEPLLRKAYSVATDRILKGTAALHLALALPRTRLEDRERLLPSRLPLARDYSP